MSSSTIKRAGNEEAAARLSLEKKACLDGIMKKAELLVESEEVQKKRLAVVAGNQVTYVAGVLWNETTGPLTLSYMYIYRGSFVQRKYPPNPLLVDVEGDFAIESGDDGVVQAVLVYSGTNEAGVEECAWGLYFYAEPNVLAEVSVWCGPIGNFLNMNKDEIKEKIKRDGKNSYCSNLGAQYAYMSAYIYNTSPGNYAVGAYYYAS
ncbi:hypothetical protein BS78_05G211000 [Paspalum vaginatum]|nr:hypothetical protein BS78_05G211000 [Paspalum vaginatum]